MHEKIIECGIIILLIYIPLDFGGVTPRAITILEVISGILLLVWLTKLFSAYKKRGRVIRSERPGISMPCLGGIIFFGALILFQLVPLPERLVHILSPTSDRLYAEESPSTAATLSKFLPVSVCPQATETELYKFLAYVVVFFLIINNIRRSKQVNRLIMVLIAMGFLEALYGLIQFVSGSYRIYTYQTDAWVHGTFVNKNHFAGYMEMVILITFGLLFTRFEQRRSSSQRYIEQTFEEKYMKAFAVLFMVFLMICAHLLSGSRGGIISFAFGVIVFALLASTRHLLRRWIIVVLIVLPLVIGTVAVMVPEQFMANLNKFTEPQFDPSFRTRWEIWRTQWHIFLDFPLVGSGLGTFSNLAQRYQTFRWSYRLAQSESDVMQLLAELGMVGIALVSWVGGKFLYAIFSKWKQRRSRWAVAIVAGGLSAIVSIVMHGGIDFNLHIPANALLFTVIAALSYVTVNIHRSEGKRHGKESKRRRAKGERQEAEDRRQKTEGRRQETENFIPHSSFLIPHSPSALRFLLFALCLFVCLYLFRMAESYYAFGQYQRVADVLSSEKPPVPDTTQEQSVISHLTTAIRHDQNNAEYAFALGKYLYRSVANTQASKTVQSDKLRLPEAETWLRKAVRLDPANPWYYYELGRLSHLQGDCPYWQDASLRQNPDKCSTARYFSMALNNAPKNEFLREQVGLWFYRYNPESAYQLIRQIMSTDLRKPPDDRNVALKFSKFLAQIGLEEESKREAEYAKQ
jgi:O-antigen ligase